MAISQQYETLQPSLLNAAHDAIERIVTAAEAQQIELPDSDLWPGDACRVLACSQFVARYLQVHPSLLADLISSGDLTNAYSSSEVIQQHVHDALEGSSDKTDLTRRLRAVRQREMLRIAWRDLGGLSDLKETLDDLSTFADAAISTSLKHLDDWLIERRGTPRDEQGQRQHLVVFALGKLGASELNFSSDVDLIFGFPSEGMTEGGQRSITNTEYFLQLSRDLIQTLHSRGADGFVFRVDMRLRPFGRAGRMALSFAALEDYYQNYGRDWERYALVRMRAVGGDIAAGEALLMILQNFVYRRYLDFGTLTALRDMKAMITDEVERRDLQHHVKLGPGGIREIEFTVQAFQLVRGGQTPALREKRLLSVMETLRSKELLPDYAIEHLIDAYCFLRRVENRLQEVDDHQTHDLPDDSQGQIQLAAAMGYAEWDTFKADLDQHRERVRGQFDQILGGETNDVETSGAVILSTESDTSVEQLLEEYGFADSKAARECFNHFRDDYQRQRLDETAETRLKRLLPDLLRAIAASDEQIPTLERVLAVVRNILRRSTYLALLHERPLTVSHLVRLCAASPWIARQIAAHPLLIDELLDARTLYAPPGLDALEVSLSEHLEAVTEGDLEQEMIALRRFKHIQVLRVAAADIAGALPLMHVSDHLSAIAEVLIRRCLALAQRDLEQRHGQPPITKEGISPAFIVVAYGKLGGLELGYGSDLDIAFLYNQCEGNTSGPRSIDSRVFYQRLCQRVIHYFTTLTTEGSLYPIDTRLRPNGQDGIIVNPLSAFAQYQHEQAWTWEHQALVRARVVAGDPDLQDQFVQLRREVLLRPREGEALKKQVTDMRMRMRNELSEPNPELFAIKQDSGGITDIEFIVQYAALRWGSQLGEHLDFTDTIRLLEGMAKQQLLSTQDADVLADAYRDYRHQIHRLSLRELPAAVSVNQFSAQRQQVQLIWQRIMEQTTDNTTGSSSS